jgi:hypothetical protein
MYVIKWGKCNITEANAFKRKRVFCGKLQAWVNRIFECGVLKCTFVYILMFKHFLVFEGKVSDVRSLQKFLCMLYRYFVGPVAQLVWRLATGWTVRGSSPGMGARFSAPVQTGPGSHPTSCTMRTGSFPGVENGRGVTLTPHPLLVPRSKTE